MNNQELQNNSLPPIGYFVWVIISIVISCIFFINTFWGTALILTPLFIGCSYIIICRNACKISFLQDGLRVKYYFPLLYEKEIKVKKSSIIEYDLGYYYYFSAEHRVGPVQLFHPCDTILFYQSDGEQKSLYNTLTIYTSYRNLKLLRQHFKENA